MAHHINSKSLHWQADIILEPLVLESFVWMQRLQVLHQFWTSGTPVESFANLAKDLSYSRVSSSKCCAEHVILEVSAVLTVGS